MAQQDASMAADSASQESDLKEARKDEMDWGYEEGTVLLCSQSVEEEEVVVVGWLGGGRRSCCDSVSRESL